MTRKPWCAYVATVFVISCFSFAAIVLISTSALAAGKPTPKPVHLSAKANNYVFPETGTLTKADLIYFANKVLSFKVKDKFDAPPDTSALYGRNFEIEIKVGTTYDVRIDTEYNAANQTLEFGILKQKWSSAYYFPSVDLQTSIRGFGLSSRNKKVRAYRASNAFGAQTVVTVIHTDTIGVAHFTRQGDRGDGLPDPRSKYHTVGGDDWYNYSVTLPPDVARQTANNAALIISGTVDKLADGRSVICHDHYHEPSIDAPNEEYGKACLVVANIDSISLIDSRSGQVLAMWSR